MAKRVRNEQEFMAIQADEDTKTNYEFEKVFLLSRVTSIERYVWPYQGDDGRPKTYVVTEDGPFVVLCPYPRFKRLWLTYRKQDEQVFTKIFTNQ